MGLGPPYPIVINQGIAAGSPFTVGDIALITGDAPPTIGNSILSQQLDGAVAYVAVSPVGTPVGSGATATFRTANGIISYGAGASSVVLGAGATATGGGGIGIGDGATSGGATPGRSIAIGLNAVAGGGAVAIGGLATATATTGTDGGVAIGNGAVAVPGGGGGGVAIGNGAAAQHRNSVAIAGTGTNTVTGGTLIIGGTTNQSQVVALGMSLHANASNGVVVGYNATLGGAGSVAIGSNADTGAFVDAIALGHGAVATAVSQCMIGGTGDGALGITVVITGNGDTAAAPVASVTHRTTGGTGSNVVGTGYLIQPGASTGNATPSQVVIYGSVVGASGSTPQMLSPIAYVVGTGVTVGDSPANFATAWGPGMPTLFAKTASGVLREANGATVNVGRINGTLVSPSGINVNDILGVLQFVGYNTSSSGVVAPSQVRSIATETWSSTGQGARIEVQTTPTGSTAGSRRTTAIFDQDGSLTLGTAAGTGANKLVAGSLQLDGGGLIRFNGYTNGSGAATGTLLNAPAAGNPAFWLPINIAGTTRFIPCW